MKGQSHEPCLWQGRSSQPLSLRDLRDQSWQHESKARISMGSCPARIGRLNGTVNACVRLGLRRCENATWQQGRFQKVNSVNLRDQLGGIISQCHRLFSGLSKSGTWFAKSIRNRNKTVSRSAVCLVLRMAAAPVLHRIPTVVAIG